MFTEGKLDTADIISLRTGGEVSGAVVVVVGQVGEGKERKAEAELINEDQVRVRQNAAKIETSTNGQQESPKSLRISSRNNTNNNRSIKSDYSSRTTGLNRVLQFIARNSGRLTASLLALALPSCIAEAKQQASSAGIGGTRGGHGTGSRNDAESLLAISCSQHKAQVAALTTTGKLPAASASDSRRAHCAIEFAESTIQLPSLSTQEAATNHQSFGDVNFTSTCGQLLIVVGGLFALIYLVNLAHLMMTNLLTKFLGGERRRSLAGSSSQRQQQQQQPHQQQPNETYRLGSGVAQSHSSSTLSLPRNSSPSPAASPRRRASRSSIHSVSAMLMSALTGGSSSSGGGGGGNSSGSHSGTNNGRSIIAKNKEDTVIIASSSPTIIQKESTDSGTSTVVSSTGGVSSMVAASPTVGMAAATSSGPTVTAGPSEAIDSELGILDQTLYDSVRHPLSLPLLTVAAGSSSNVIAVAAAAIAAGDSQQSQQQLLLGQLPTVSTQLGLDRQTLSGSQTSQQTQGPQAGQTTSHAPLNATNTMKQAPGVGSASSTSPTTSTSSPRRPVPASSNASVIARRSEVIKATELLLNALNQGDYDTYTRLCDPHMTSFEPENLGHLIDNMEYRRLCLDQARQLHFHHLYQQQIISYSQNSQQVAATAAAAAASAAAVAAFGANGNNNNNNNNNNKQQLHQFSGQQLQQVAQAAALGAANAALANMSLGSKQPSSAGATTPTGPQSQAPAVPASAIASQQAAQYNQPANCASLRQYSIMLNPAVYLLGDEAASIAYTKLSQTINLLTGQLSSEQSEETRVWHKKDGNKWVCVHFHRSTPPPHNPTLTHHLSDPCGPQTSVSLIRSMFNQQQLASLHQLHQPQQQQQTNVPLISLNYSSTGGTINSNNNSSQNQSAPNNSSR